jgi:hypothetical protein
VQVLISVADGADGSGMTEFYGWLRETRAVTRGAEVKLLAEGGHGTMSGGDVIALTVSAVSALSATVQAYAAWRSSRSAAPPVKFSFDGKDVIVVIGSAEEAAIILQIAEAQVAEGEQP